MGVVYKAYQVGLKRTVALKSINIRTDRPLSLASLDRFRTEGEAIARLQHPHIVQVYDVSEQNGVPFLAMEFVEGTTLAAKIHGEPLPARQAARLAEQLAGAVHYAHGRGVIHRDLKPSNVMLTTDGVPKLTDFGLAKLLESEPGLYPTAGPLGTPAYMAPEQANGQVDRMGRRTDVFGLGAILYEMLAGRPPFKGEDSSATWSLARQCQFTPPRQINRQVPRTLERICLKALAADPDQRFSTAGDMQRALQRFLMRRARWVGGTIALFVLGAALGGYSSAFRSVHLPPRPLTGDLIVRVWDHQGRKQGLELDRAGALPVVNGDLVHLEAQLNQPAYLYLLWVGGTGKVQPLYPWDPEKGFADPTPSISPSAVLHSPKELTAGWPVTGSSGLETVILLASTGPLPPEIQLQQEIGQLPPAALGDPREVAWLECALGLESPRRQKAIYRDVNTTAAQHIDDAILQMMDRLRPHFELIKVVRFAHYGN
jgi:hypothetical protein